MSRNMKSILFNLGLLVWNPSLMSNSLTLIFYDDIVRAYAFIIRLLKLSEHTASSLCVAKIQVK